MCEVIVVACETNFVWHLIIPQKRSQGSRTYFEEAALGLQGISMQTKSKERAISSMEKLRRLSLWVKKKQPEEVRTRVSMCCV